MSHPALDAEYARMNDEAREESARLVARWREGHPEATCSDHVALTLARLEQEFGRGSARPAKGE